ncbi:MAG TPA: hypothetical protein VK698_10320 [Kofleriaceae bacterium]|nr:hypothetical protein [Kofleriaceae bacterium]
MHAGTRWLASLVLASALGCGTDQPGDSGDDGVTDDGDGTGGDGTGGDDGLGGEVIDGVTLSGEVSASGRYSGTISIAADATIPAGVEIDVEPGSAIVAADGVALTVSGTLLVTGATGQTVSIVPEEGSLGWKGIRAESGGSVIIHHATGTRVATLLECHAGAIACAVDAIDFEHVGKIISAAATATLTSSRVVDMANGAVYVQAGGDLTVSDTELMTSQGDIVVTGGGRLLVEYSNIGGTVDTYEHCNLHIGQADALVVRYSNIVTGQYGMMIGGIDGAEITHNNFEGNSTDIDPVGVVTAADFTENYWADGTPPLGAEYDFSSAASARIAEAGPRQ